MCTRLSKRQRCGSSTSTGISRHKRSFVVLTHCSLPPLHELPIKKCTRTFVAKRLSKSSTAPKHLRDGLVIGIKVIVFTPFPSGFQFGLSNVPVRTALPQHRTQVSPKLFDGWSAKKPVAVIDLEYNQTWFEDDDIRDHRIVLGVCVLGDVKILLNLASRIG